MQIQIKVFQDSDAFHAQRGKCFERILEQDSAVEFPQTTILSALKLLFGAQSVVCFNYLP